LLNTLGAAKTIIVRGWNQNATANYLCGRVIPEDLLSILKMENPSPEGFSNGLSPLAAVCGVMEHCKISNSKHQITSKSQIPISNDQNSLVRRSRIGHCYLFDI